MLVNLPIESLKALCLLKVPGYEKLQEAVDNMEKEILFFEDRIQSMEATIENIETANVVWNEVLSKRLTVLKNCMKALKNNIIARTFLEINPRVEAHIVVVIKHIENIFTLESFVESKKFKKELIIIDNSIKFIYISASNYKEKTLV